MRGVPWPKMVDVLPEGGHGECKVTHYEVTPQDESISRARSVFSFGRPDYVEAGRYCRLEVGRVLMMTDTRGEKRSNTGAVVNARGHMLIGGMGMGMVLIPILGKPEVESVTVVELSQDVIDFVVPHVRRHLSKKQNAKLTVIQGDIFEWAPAPNTQYDSIYFDIWPDICTDNLKDMTKLHRRFGRRKAPGGWIDSWKRDELKYLKRQQDRQDRAFGRFR